MNNPFTPQEQDRPYADHELSTLQQELERIDQEVEELNQKKQELAVCQSQIKNEIMQRIKDDKVKKLSTDSVTYTLVRKNNIKINDKDPALLEFAKKHNYITEKPDTKAIEKVIDPDNSPEWATVSVSEHLRKAQNN